MASRGSAFHYETRGTTYGEIYRENNKSNVYGWKSGKNEDCYSIATLMANWNEERADIKYIRSHRKPKSDYSHYFETSNPRPERNIVPDSVKYAMKRDPYAYPAHQPELDPEEARSFNTLITNSQISYQDPKAHTNSVTAEN